jgi:Cu(I)/Ag(I) efflux system membrane protein CusA/SilA
MKPLATPVLGGMVSSLVHVLIVTPVIFFWLHERQLRHQAARESQREMMVEMTSLSSETERKI